MRNRSIEPAKGIDRGPTGDRRLRVPTHQGMRQITLISVFGRRWPTLLVALAVCVIVAAVYVVRATPIYTSSCRIFVEQNLPKLLNDSQAVAVAQSDSYLYTEIEVLSSYSILAAALEEPMVGQLRVLSEPKDKLQYLKKHLDVQVGKKDNIITVAFGAPDPREAAVVVNAVVKAFVDYESSKRRSTAGEMLKILSSEKDKHELKLSQQEDALVKFRQANGDAFFQTDRGNIVMQDLAMLSDGLARAKLDAQRAEADYWVSNSRLAAHEVWLRALERLRRYQQVYDDEEQKALAMNTKTAQYNKLHADVERTNKMVDLLDTRIKELNVAEHSGPLNISILETGRPEEVPSHPRKALTLAAAAIIGLFLGAGCALVQEGIDTRLRSVEDVADLLGLPVLGIIPSMAACRGLAAAREVQLEPASEVSEAYRGLRTALHFGLPGRPAKTVLVTSPSSGDGKSTTASNLAVALAQADCHTLLIDADLRQPAQHKAFGLDGGVGLTDVLARGVPVEQAVRRTQVEGLDLLPCGTLPTNPSDLLNSEAFEIMLMKLSQKYDQIVLDSPPVLPVADARILSAQCDATLLVLRRKRSTRKGAEQARDRLFGRVVGAVMNDVPGRRARYGSAADYDRSSVRDLQHLPALPPTVRREIKVRAVEVESANELEAEPAMDPPASHSIEQRASQRSAQRYASR